MRVESLKTFYRGTLGGQGMKMQKKLKLLENINAERLHVLVAHLPTFRRIIKITHHGHRQKKAAQNIKNSCSDA